VEGNGGAEGISVVTKMTVHFVGAKRSLGDVSLDPSEAAQMAEGKADD